MKILYIDSRVGDATYCHYNTIYHGLVNSNHHVKHINSRQLNNDIVQEFDNFDMVIIGYGYMSQGTAGAYSCRYQTTTPVVTFLYKLSHCTGPKIHFMKENSMIILGSQSRIPELMEVYDLNITPVLYPFQADIFKDYGLNKIYDIGISGALHGAKLYSKSSFRPEERDIRHRIVKLLENSQFKCFIKTSDTTVEGGRVMNHTEYAQTINQARIWVATNAEHGDLTPRFCEVPACRTLLFCNEQLHDTFNTIFKDGVTCVYFKNDLSDFVQKVEYYLSHVDEYNKIVDYAYKYFHTHHNTVSHIDTLTEIVKNKNL